MTIDDDIEDVIKITRALPKVKEKYNKSNKKEKRLMIEMIQEIDGELAFDFADKGIVDFESKLLNISDDTTIKSIVKLFERLEGGENSEEKSIIDSY